MEAVKLETTETENSNVDIGILKKEALKGILKMGLKQEPQRYEIGRPQDLAPVSDFREVTKEDGINSQDEPSDVSETLLKAETNISGPGIICQEDSESVPKSDVAKSQNAESEQSSSLLPAVFCHVRMAVICTLQFLHPFKILQLISECLQQFTRFTTTVHLRTKRRPKLLKWVQDSVPAGRQVPDLTTVWRDGTILCDVIETVVPGSCTEKMRQHYCHKSIQHGQMLAAKHLGVQPVFSSEDLNQVAFSKYLERRFVRYLVNFRCAIFELRQYNSPFSRRLRSFRSSYSNAPVPEPEREKLPMDCIAKGMGLVVAVQGRRASFYIYILQIDSTTPIYDPLMPDIIVQITGPNDNYGEIVIQNLQSPKNKRQSSRPLTLCMKKRSSGEMCTIPVNYYLTSTRIRVNYIPQNPGIHELCVLRLGQHVPGSPYSVTVDRKPPDTPTQTSSGISDEEEVIKPKPSFRKLRILLRIVDFINEKMLLTDDGRFKKLSNNGITSSGRVSTQKAIEAKPENEESSPESHDTLESTDEGTSEYSSVSDTESNGRNITPLSYESENNEKSTSSSAGALYENIHNENFSPLEVQNSMDSIIICERKIKYLSKVNREKDSEDNYVPKEISPERKDLDFFRKRCKKVMTMCRFMMLNSSRQRSLHILSTAGHIFDGRPVRVTENTYRLIESALKEMCTESSIPTPICVFNQEEISTKNKSPNTNIEKQNSNCGYEVQISKVIEKPNEEKHKCMFNSIAAITDHILDVKRNNFVTAELTGTVTDGTLMKSSNSNSKTEYNVTESQQKSEENNYESDLCKSKQVMENKDSTILDEICNHSYDKHIKNIRNEQDAKNALEDDTELQTQVFIGAIIDGTLTKSSNSNSKTEENTNENKSEEDCIYKSDPCISMQIKEPKDMILDEFCNHSSDEHIKDIQNELHIKIAQTDADELKTGLPTATGTDKENPGSGTISVHENVINQYFNMEVNDNNTDDINTYVTSTNSPFQYRDEMCSFREEFNKKYHDVGIYHGNVPGSLESPGASANSFKTEPNKYTGECDIDFEICQSTNGNSLSGNVEIKIENIQNACDVESNTESIKSSLQPQFLLYTKDSKIISKDSFQQLGGSICPEVCKNNEYDTVEANDTLTNNENYTFSENVKEFTPEVYNSLEIIIPELSVGVGPASASSPTGDECHGQSANFPELEDILSQNFTDYMASSNNDNQDQQFHLWSSDVAFDSRPTSTHLVDSKIDFDSVLAAPNLEEALKKLEQGLQVPNNDKDKLSDVDELSESLYREGDLSPYQDPIDSEGSSPYGEVMADINLQGNEEMAQDPDDVGNVSYDIGDSDYVSMDELQSSFKQSPENRNNDESRNGNKPAAGNEIRAYIEGSKLSMSRLMGPAEKEIWGIAEGNNVDTSEYNRSSKSLEPEYTGELGNVRFYPRVLTPGAAMMNPILEELEENEYDIASEPAEIHKESYNVQDIYPIHSKHFKNDDRPEQDRTIDYVVENEENVTHICIQDNKSFTHESEEYKRDLVEDLLTSTGVIYSKENDHSVYADITEPMEGTNKNEPSILREENPVDMNSGGETLITNNDCVYLEEIINNVYIAPQENERSETVEMGNKLVKDNLTLETLSYIVQNKADEIEYKLVEYNNVSMQPSLETVQNNIGLTETKENSAENESENVSFFSETVKHGEEIKADNVTSTSLFQGTLNNKVVEVEDNLAEDIVKNSESFPDNVDRLLVEIVNDETENPANISEIMRSQATGSEESVKIDRNELVTLNNKAREIEDNLREDIIRSPESSHDNVDSLLVEIVNDETENSPNISEIMHSQATGSEENVKIDTNELVTLNNKTDEIEDNLAEDIVKSSESFQDNMDSLPVETVHDVKENSPYSEITQNQMNGSEENIGRDRSQLQLIPSQIISEEVHTIDENVAEDSTGRFSKDDSALRSDEKEEKLTVNTVENSTSCLENKNSLSYEIGQHFAAETRDPQYSCPETLQGILNTAGENYYEKDKDCSPSFSAVAHRNEETGLNVIEENAELRNLCYFREMVSIKTAEREENLSEEVLESFLLSTEVVENKKGEEEYDPVQLVNHTSLSFSAITQNENGDLENILGEDITERILFSSQENTYNQKDEREIYTAEASIEVSKCFPETTERKSSRAKENMIADNTLSDLTVSTVVEEGKNDQLFKHASKIAEEQLYMSDNDKLQIGESTKTSIPEISKNADYLDITNGSSMGMVTNPVISNVSENEHRDEVVQLDTVNYNTIQSVQEECAHMLSMNSSGKILHQDHLKENKDSPITDSTIAQIDRNSIGVFLNDEPLVELNCVVKAENIREYNSSLIENDPHSYVSLQHVEECERNTQMADSEKPYLETTSLLNFENERPYVPMSLHHEGEYTNVNRDVELEVILEANCDRPAVGNLCDLNRKDLENKSNIITSVQSNSMLIETEILLLTENESDRKSRTESHISDINYFSDKSVSKEIHTTDINSLDSIANIPVEENYKSVDDKTFSAACDDVFPSSMRVSQRKVYWDNKFLQQQNEVTQNYVPIPKKRTKLNYSPGELNVDNSLNISSKKSNAERIRSTYKPQSITDDGTVNNSEVSASKKEENDTEDQNADHYLEHGDKDMLNANNECCSPTSLLFSNSETRMIEFIDNVNEDEFSKADEDRISHSSEMDSLGVTNEAQHITWRAISLQQSASIITRDTDTLVPLVAEKIDPDNKLDNKVDEIFYEIFNGIAENSVDVIAGDEKENSESTDIKQCNESLDVKDISYETHSMNSIKESSKSNEISACPRVVNSTFTPGTEYLETELTQNISDKTVDKKCPISYDFERTKINISKLPQNCNRMFPTSQNVNIAITNSPEESIMSVLEESYSCNEGSLSNHEKPCFKIACTSSEEKGYSGSLQEKCKENNVTPITGITLSVDKTCETNNNLNFSSETNEVTQACTPDFDDSFKIAMHVNERKQYWDQKLNQNNETSENGILKLQKRTRKGMSYSEMYLNICNNTDNGSLNRRHPSIRIPGIVDKWKKTFEEKQYYDEESKSLPTELLYSENFNRSIVSQCKQQWNELANAQSENRFHSSQYGCKAPKQSAIQTLGLVARERLKFEEHCNTSNCININSFNTAASTYPLKEIKLRSDNSDKPDEHVDSKYSANCLYGNEEDYSYRTQDSPQYVKNTKYDTGFAVNDNEVSNHGENLQYNDLKSKGYVSPFMKLQEDDIYAQRDDTYYRARLVQMTEDGYRTPTPNTMFLLTKPRIKTNNSTTLTNKQANVLPGNESTLKNEQSGQISRFELNEPELKSCSSTEIIEEQKSRFERTKKFFQMLESKKPVSPTNRRRHRISESYWKVNKSLDFDEPSKVQNVYGGTWGSAPGLQQNEKEGFDNKKSSSKKKRCTKCGKIKKKKNKATETSSAPTSDTETNARTYYFKSRGEEFGGSERIPKKKVSERFHVKDLFKDVIGDSDSSLGCFFKGIPHREAVLASLRSMDTNCNIQHPTKERVDHSNPPPRSYLQEYPYIPTTPPCMYRPRSSFLPNKLITRRELLELEEQIM